MKATEIRYFLRKYCLFSFYDQAGLCRYEYSSLFISNWTAINDQADKNLSTVKNPDKKKYVKKIPQKRMILTRPTKARKLTSKVKTGTFRNIN